jgi:alpha-N-arabinofuranosidase
MRAANGSEEPCGVKLWFLGNEMDGPWQLGHVPARDYAVRAQQAAKMMKDCDRTIELVACGSCSVGLQTYMEWDREVLEYVGDLADHLSIHRYVSNSENDTPDYLAVTSSFDRQIEEADAVCRYVQARTRAKKRAFVCFDEWNVWSSEEHAEMTSGEGEFPRHLNECVYTLEDALVVAGFLHSFIRHADCVKIANLAQVVNVIAPVHTRGDDMFLQTIFHPFEMFSKRRDGVSLRCAVEGPGYEGKTNGRVDFVDASAILGEGALHVFLTNRSLDERAEVRVELAGGAIASSEGGELFAGPGPKAVNSFEEPDVVTQRPLEGVKVEGGAATIELPPLSFAAATFGLE